MDQNTHPAPFNLGDHLCYVGPKRRREPPVGSQGSTEVVLTRDMIGVVILSSGDLSGEDARGSRPWRCQAQFRNGFQLDITLQNCADLALPRHESTAVSQGQALGPEPTQEPDPSQREPGNDPAGEPGNDWVTPAAERPPKQGEGIVSDPDRHATGPLKASTAWNLR